MQQQSRSPVHGEDEPDISSEGNESYLEGKLWFPTQMFVLCDKPNEHLFLLLLFSTTVHYGTYNTTLTILTYRQCEVLAQLTTLYCTLYIHVHLHLHICAI